MSKTVLLGDVVRVVKGISYRSEDYREDGAGRIFINLKCVGRGGGFRIDGIKYYGGPFKQEQTANSGDILIANTDLTQDRDVIGSPIIIPELDGQACFSLDLSKLEITHPELIDKDYLFYFLKSPIARHFMISHSNGSTVMHLSVSAVPKLPINLPPLEQQKTTVAILKCIDEKIELNRRMNQRLDQMGQALFKEYFVDHPETKNWTMRSLGEFFDVKTGKKDANFGTTDGAYPFFTCAQAASKAPDFSFDGDAILLAGNGDFNIKYYRGRFEAYQRTYVLIPDNTKLLGYLFFLMKLNLADITGGSRGSVIKFITKGMIENYKFPAPTDMLLEDLSGIFNQLTISISSNVVEIEKLAAMRDTLLPRLISGSIST
jgi:type I restriction enzyme S subunit